jgi:DNA uptake protein ComE-like DNA-binding protein
MTKMEVTNKKIVKETSYNGSALILTVVLTTLLATIGVLFVLLSRIDKMAASTASQNRELNFAVDTVVAKISQELVLDVPGVEGQEYYDYPDANNAWLAALEPNKSGYWPQITDLYHKLGLYSRNMLIEVIPDYQDSAQVNDSNGYDPIIVLCPADADGDGVADSMWVKVNDITSSKGRPIYAAIRIIDNGGMLNVNTAYEFNPNETDSNLIDGSSQMQINLLALAARGSTTNPLGKLDDARFGSELHVLDNYINDVVWQYNSPNGAYTPFDISDELELRNHFLLNQNNAGARIDARVERFGWTGSFIYNNIEVPIGSGGSSLGVNDWFMRANTSVDANFYDYRHIATTCNMDRIIRPDGGKMVDVNTASAQELYSVLKAIIDPNLSAQLAVNIVDLRDDDANVTVFSPSGGPPYYYGFEAQPFISEMAFKIDGNDPVTSAKNYFAIELYNPFEVPIPLGDFRLVLRQHSGGVAKTINLAGYMISAKSWFVITNGLAATTDFGVTGLMSSIPPRGKQDPNLLLAKYKYDSILKTYVLEETYDIYLLRKIWLPPSNIYLDKELISNEAFDFDTVKGLKQFYYRPDNNWNIVYREMSTDSSGKGTLGKANGELSTGHNYNIPTFRRFVTVGDIARVLTVGPSPDPNDMIGEQLWTDPPEKDIRIDLVAKPIYQQIFNYLTVFDPNDPKYGGHPATETRIKGRININTAPWFVIAQLPWMQPSIAQAIVDYRDTIAKKFKSIGELMNVAEMDYYKTLQLDDLTGFPDLTPGGSTGDGAADDFEERDVIFARISNLITVRSDVFTAYILVRIGSNGPQKRVIAILDRSQVTSPTDKVKIIAIQPVPDPR